LAKVPDELLKENIDRVWLDLETTGLDHRRDPIIEMGLQVGDVYGNVGDAFRRVIWAPNWRERMESNALVDEMHTKSGLKELLAELDHAPELRIEPYQAEAQALYWLKELGLPAGELKVAGSSVQFDRRFLSESMPDLESFFYHRIVDVSSFKETCKGLNPELYAKLVPTTNPRKLHRVQPDIEDTLAEYRFYVDNFFFW
jgi:oligoribonuclease